MINQLFSVGVAAGVYRPTPEFGWLKVEQTIMRMTNPDLLRHTVDCLPASEVRRREALQEHIQRMLAQQDAEMAQTMAKIKEERAVFDEEVAKLRTQHEEENVASKRDADDRIAQLLAQADMLRSNLALPSGTYDYKKAGGGGLPTE